MQQKKVFITGANKSIGYHTAKALLNKGYFVYLGSRDLEKGKAAVANFKTEGLTGVMPVQIDVTNTDSITQAYKTIAKTTDILDVLINNAGILGEVPQDASETSLTNIKNVFNTNFFGTIAVTQQFLPLLKPALNPVIVNVTSGLASLSLHADPDWKYYHFKGGAYAPSKTALNAYTQALAYDLKHFKVNAVDPGYTATDFNNHSGTESVASSGIFVANYAMLAEDGPTGKFFSHEMKGTNKEYPW